MTGSKQCWGLSNKNSPSVPLSPRSMSPKKLTWLCIQTTPLHGVLGMRHLSHISYPFEGRERFSYFTSILSHRWPPMPNQNLVFLPCRYCGLTEEVTTLSGSSNSSVCCRQLRSVDRDHYCSMIQSTKGPQIMQHNSCKMTTQKDVDWKQFNDFHLGIRGNG